MWTVVLLFCLMNVGLVSSADENIIFNALMSQMSSSNFSIDSSVDSPLYSGSILVYQLASCSSTPEIVSYSVPGKTAACGEECIIQPGGSLKIWCGQSSSQTTFQMILYTITNCAGSESNAITGIAIGNGGTNKCIAGTLTYQGVTIPAGFKVDCGANPQPPANSINSMCPTAGGSSGSGGTNWAMIIGIIVAVTVVVIAGIVLYCYCRRRSAQQQFQQSAPLSIGQSAPAGNYQPNYQPNYNQPNYQPPTNTGYANPTQGVVWGNPSNPNAYNRM